jgi:protocatechuate 3,4-dioxygenase alpha subunit
VNFTVTGSQTVGPFFHVGLAGLFRSDMTCGVRLKPDATGLPDAAGLPDATVVSIRGRVIDGDRNAVPDAMLEIWQAETGAFARVPTDADGAFSFTAVPSPFLSVTIFMRGLLRQLHTRIYLSDGPANDDDPILRLVEAARRRTLIAKPIAGAASDLEWNIVLQGDDETVFFEC